MYANLSLTLDTNILISSLMTEGTPPDLLFMAWQAERFSLVTSEEQLDELARVLSYPKLKPYINPLEGRELLYGLRNHAVLVKELPIVSYSADYADNIILATALKGQCNFLVTGDKKDLLSLKVVEHISIITARAALEIINA